LRESWHALIPRGELLGQIPIEELVPEPVESEREAIGRFWDEF
jgi:hypothetical protein